MHVMNVVKICRNAYNVRKNQNKKYLFILVDLLITFIIYNINDEYYIIIMIILN